MTDLPGAPPEAPVPAWAVRADRERSLGGRGRLLTGTAAELADLVGVDVVSMRLAFVVLAVAGGAGVVAYAAAWAWFVAVWRPDPAPTDAATDPAADGRRDLGFGVVVLGALLEVRAWDIGFVDAVVWPVAVAALGLAVAWRRTDATEWTVAAAGRTFRLGRLSVSAATVRFVVGAVLLIAGFVALVGAELTSSIRALAGLVVLLGGIGLMFAPMLGSLATALVDERRQRIRADERARISSHLHDSVLQTLTLIQKRSTDAAEVASLARRQERELREWLYGDAERTAGSFAAALEAAAAEVEDRHRVVVECVIVGDLPLDDASSAVVGAAREAMVNAAKFSGTARVSTYAEVRPDAVEVFVRDTGVGFDPAAVPEDRQGIRHSIVDRVRRVGGTATIRAAVDEGAEVVIVLPRPAADRSSS